MAMIKSSQTDMMSHQAIVLDLGDLRHQADTMRRAAETEAQRIIADAESRASQLGLDAAQQGRAQGYAEGKAAGHALGLEAGRKEGFEAALAQHKQALDQIQDAWVAAARKWDEQRRQMLQEARQSLLKLAVEMARKIVHRIPEFDPSIVVDQVAAAIEHVARPCDISIRIHPEDRPLLEAAMPKLIQGFSATRHVTLADDPAVARGGCVLQYGRGRIDATLDTQLKRLIETMLGNPGDQLPHTTQAPHHQEGPAS